MFFFFREKIVQNIINVEWLYQPKVREKLVVKNPPSTQYSPEN